MISGSSQNWQEASRIRLRKRQVLREARGWTSASSCSRSSLIRLTGLWGCLLHNHHHENWLFLPLGLIINSPLPPGVIYWRFRVLSGITNLTHFWGQSSVTFLLVVKGARISLPTNISTKEDPPTQGGSDAGQLMIPVLTQIQVPEHVIEALHHLPQTITSRFPPLCTN